MKFRKMKNKFVRKGGFLNIDGGGGNDNSGAGGGGSDSNANSDSENNTGNNSETFDNIWQDPEPQNQNQSPDNANLQNNQNQPDPEQAFNQRIESLGLFNNLQNIDFSDPENAQKALQETIANTYRAAMLDANQLFEERMEAVRKEFENKTETTVRQNSMLAQLHETLQFTKQPAYKPIAEAVFSRFLQQENTTPEQAIQNTKAYFEKLGNELAGNSQNTNGTNSGGLNGFPKDGTPSHPNAQADEKMWLNFLQAAPQNQ